MTRAGLVEFADPLQVLLDVTHGTGRTSGRLDVELRTGQQLLFDVPVPQPMPALAIKAAAYCSRLLDKDAVDIWRLLEVAGVTPTDWDRSGTRTDARRVLHGYLGRRSAPGTVAAASADGIRTPASPTWS